MYQSAKYIFLLLLLGLTFAFSSVLKVANNKYILLQYSMLAAVGLEANMNTDQLKNNYHNCKLSLLNTKHWIWNIWRSDWLSTHGTNPIPCSLSMQIWKLTILSRYIFSQNGRKLESVKNKIRDVFIQCLVF